MVQLKIPGNSATAYAEVLAEREVDSVTQLTSLTPELLDACSMRSSHRQMLKAAALLSGPMELLEGSASPAPMVAEMPQRVQRTGRPTPKVAAPLDDADGEALPDETDDRTTSVAVGVDLDGSRVDAALAALLPPLSRSYFGALCSEGRVRIDGLPVAKKSAKVSAGALLEVRLRAAAELSVTPEAIDLDILYEDASMIAVNKPSGMVVHPAPGHWSGTFANALVHRIKQEQQGKQQTPPPPPEESEDGDTTDGEDAGGSVPDAFGDGLRPGIVHRLDRYTTGVLLGAKTTRAQRHLLDAFAARRVDKVYLAVVAGAPKEPTTFVQAPIGRHPTDRVRMAAVEVGGRAALSAAHVLASDGRLSLLAVRIGTGRTHQIRVHLNHLRCPVLGDPLYGDKSVNKRESRRAARPLLHAYQLAVESPSPEGGRLVLHAPPPDDLAAVASALAGCAPDELSAWLSPRLDAALAASSARFDELMEGIR